jgi:hypothetical protein
MQVNQLPVSRQLPDSGQSPRTAEDRKAHGRSRVTNGGDASIPKVDGRKWIAKRYREIAAAIFSDQGGVDRCSESRKQLIRRFAAAAVLAEELEVQLARGEEVDINRHALLCSTLVRIAQRTGLHRMPRDVVPTLTEYLHARASSEPEKDAE